MLHRAAIALQPQGHNDLFHIGILANAIGVEAHEQGFFCRDIEGGFFADFEPAQNVGRHTVKMLAYLADEIGLIHD